MTEHPPPAPSNGQTHEAANSRPPKKRRATGLVIAAVGLAALALIAAITG